MAHQLLLTYVRPVLLVLACLMPCAPALAVPVVYTDRAAFDAAVGSYTLLRLGDSRVQDIPPETEFGSWNTVYNDLLVFATGDNLTNCAPIMGCLGYSTGVFVIQPPVRLPVMTFGFVEQPVTAFGFDYTVVDDGAFDPFRNAYANFMGDEYVLAKPGGFLGFVSPIPFDASVGSGFFTLTYVMDNFAIQTQAIPEPATWWLVIAGSLVVVLARWRIFGLVR